MSKAKTKDYYIKKIMKKEERFNEIQPTYKPTKESFLKRETLLSLQYMYNQLKIDLEQEEFKQSILDQQTEETDNYMSKLTKKDKAVQKLKNQLFAMSQVRTKIGSNGELTEEVPYFKTTNPTRSTTSIGAGPMGSARRPKSAEYTTDELKKFRYAIRA